jgi:hypothetical protein
MIGVILGFNVVAEPARRSPTIASDHACTGEFETFCMADLL